MSQVGQVDLRSPDADEDEPLVDTLETYRVELRGYCYRMLGSAFDADDAVQETLVKAWKGLDRFEGRASLRSWLYRIATNVCLDSLRSRQRRALPMDLSSPVPATTAPGAPLAAEVWIEPAPDADVLPVETDPAQRVVLADSVRLAFIAALQHLPPRQRAVLILREVLCWQASEVAELLDTTVASVNSALQRARATLGERNPGGSHLADGAAAAGPRGDSAPGGRVQSLTVAERLLLDRYVSAFEAYDITSLVALLREDATFSMPPLALWLRGRHDVHDWYLGFGAACRGSRLIPLVANGAPGFAQYKPAPGGGYEPWAIQVVEMSGGQITHLHHFLDTGLFARFGLPAHL